MRYENMKELAEVRTLKVNRYIIIDDEPCKIVSISTSKPGKHGEAKARIEAIGVFDQQKRSIVHPVTHKVSVPIINKGTAQVIAVMGDTVQLMDMETYETFDMPIPDEFKGQLEAGKEIQYLEALGRRKITRV
ncbi:MAG TPA: translation initiation factor IF-5A [Thermoplasmatales archaeon]|nr:translation initiation factor IF-5A [Thermoplasmatales archaeon]